MSRHDLKVISPDKLKRWLRRSDPLRERMATGVLGLQVGGRQSKEVRLSYKKYVPTEFTLSGAKFTLGKPKHTSLIIAEFPLRTNDLSGQHPEEEVVIEGKPLGWKVYIFGARGTEVDFEHVVTAPSVLAAVVYVDLTLV